MAKIISKIDTKLIIPPGFKGLTGRESLEIEFKAGEITEVSERVAEYYTKSRPKVFRYAETEDFQLYTEEERKEQPPVEFDALKFFEENVDNIEEAIRNLIDRKKLFAVCKFMGLTGYVTQDSERIKERVLADIKIQKEQQEKMSNQ